jgi:hypothetical protein
MCPNGAKNAPDASLSFDCSDLEELRTPHAVHPELISSENDTEVAINRISRAEGVHVIEAGDDV